ncbi:MAG: porin family protein [Desulfuromonadales bacterium]|nr:porin family protein [Desulfuromonadales bacterium]
MKKMSIVGLAMMVVLGGLVSSALAAPYVSGSFGMVSVNDADVSGNNSGELTFDPGFGFIAAVGNGFDGLRGEIEMAYRNNDLDKFSNNNTTGDITSLAVMGNILVDLAVSETVRPFLGAGIGLANVEVNSNVFGDKDDTVFAYQAIAGLGFPLTHVTTLDLQYRYFATADADFAGAEAEYQTHNFFAGLRFDF